MNIKNRLAKLEKGQNKSNLAVITVIEGETNEEACLRCFPDGNRPKVIIYLTPLDVLL